MRIHSAQESQRLSRGGRWDGARDLLMDGRKLLTGCCPACGANCPGVRRLYIKVVFVSSRIASKKSPRFTIEAIGSLLHSCLCKVNEEMTKKVMLVLMIAALVMTSAAQIATGNQQYQANTAG